jgi:tetratricopeptide (TPR) repeat protein
LMENVSWYPPIYLESAKFEEKIGSLNRALAIVSKGLKMNERYGPLWFMYFRLKEKTETKSETLAHWNAYYAWAKNAPANKNTGAAASSHGDSVMSKCKDKPEFQLRLAETLRVLHNSVDFVSKELVWKVHFETAQVMERAANTFRRVGRQEVHLLSSGAGEDRGTARAFNYADRAKLWIARARKAYTRCVSFCPPPLRWKVWVAGARTEVADGNLFAAEQLLERALGEVPSKAKSQVILDCARLEEFRGNADSSRSILRRYRAEVRKINPKKHAPWKVYLESILVEKRSGRIAAAIRQAKRALCVHSGTGRLWAMLIQLQHSSGPKAQFKVLRRALDEVPKSGEVWCEAARLHMDPLSAYFDLGRASQYLDFAIQVGLFARVSAALFFFLSFLSFFSFFFLIFFLNHARTHA